MLSLYSLTSNPAHRVVRFRLDSDVQKALQTLLKSQESAFDNLAEQEIVFDGKYKPDAGEVLKIENYEDIDHLDEVIKNPLGIPEIVATPKGFSEIRALFSGYVRDGEVTVLIQQFDRRRIISTSGLSIFHAADVFKKIDGAGITLDTKLAAILQGKTLRFVSFHAARQIFDLSAYFREATDSDISDFVSLPAIEVTDLPKLIEISDTWIRRKFWLVQQSKILEKIPMEEIKTVAAEFKIQLVTKVNGDFETIVLPDSKPELKRLLRFLDEDYYKSPLSNTSYITNSKRPA
jgi:hypothetical protein